MTNGSNRYPDTIEWAFFLPYAGPIVIEKTWKWVPKTVMETETIENARDATPLTSIMKQKVPPRCGFFSHAIRIFSPARRKHEQGHGLAPSYVVDRKCFKNCCVQIFCVNCRNSSGRNSGGTVVFLSGWKPLLAPTLAAQM